MAIGDIGAIIDSWEFDETRGAFPDIVHIAGEVYAITYAADGGTGTIKTVRIDPDGVIDPAGMDTEEFDNTQGYYSRITHIDGTIYAIAYNGPDGDGWLKTVSISGEGAISFVGMDSEEFDLELCNYPDLIHIAGNMYAILYSGDGNAGRIQTRTISEDGVIGAAATDNNNFDAVYGSEPSIIRVSDTIYAIAYHGVGDDGWLKTVSISDEGAISFAGMDSLEFNTDYGLSPDIISLGSNVYAIAYQGPSNRGWIKRVEIEGTGNIKESTAAAFEFEHTNSSWPKIVYLGNNKYAIAYTGIDNDGWLQGITLPPTGDITMSPTNHLEYDISLSANNKIIHITGNIYAIAYSGPGQDGWLKTMSIETQVPSNVKYIMMVGVG